MGSAMGARYCAGGLATPASVSAFAPRGLRGLAEELDQAEEPILLALSQAVRG